MNIFKFKKGIYIVKSGSLIDSYKYDLYIAKNKIDAKKQYAKCYGENLTKYEAENTIQDVTILRICQVLEKLKYMPKSHYFNLQDATVLNWLEKEFKIILKESEQKNKKEEKDDSKSNN